MTVAELIKALEAMPQDAQVEPIYVDRVRLLNGGMAYGRFRFGTDEEEPGAVSITATIDPRPAAPPALTAKTVEMAREAYKGLKFRPMSEAPKDRTICLFCPKSAMMGDLFPAKWGENIVMTNRYGKEGWLMSGYRSLLISMLDLTPEAWSEMPEARSEEHPQGVGPSL